MKPVGYTKGRWQDAQDEEGANHPLEARQKYEFLRLGTNVVPLLIECLTDETKTKDPVWDFWPETRVGDIAFDVLCDLFSDPRGQRTLDGVIMWPDVQAESPGQPAWIAWEIYNKKHGQQYVQQVWLKAWSENKSRIYWDESASCFKAKGTP
jgi:hypothetical protein